MKSKKGRRGWKGVEKSGSEKAEWAPRPKPSVVLQSRFSRVCTLVPVSEPKRVKSLPAGTHSTEKYVNQGSLCPGECRNYAREQEATSSQPVSYRGWLHRGGGSGCRQGGGGNLTLSHLVPSAEAGAPPTALRCSPFPLPPPPSPSLLLPSGLGPGT